MSEPAADPSTVRMFIDFDGYFMALVAEGRLPPPQPPMRDLTTLGQASLLHYVLRSTVVLHRDADRSTLREYRRWSKFCLRIGQKHALAYASDAVLAPPEWASLFDDAIKDALRERFPVVDDVRVHATLEPRLYARSFPQSRQIHVSALTREYLRTFNLVLWNTVYQVTEPDGEVPDLDCAGLLLPYLVSLYRTANFSGLPIPRAYDLRAMRLALLSTRIQLMFLLAHEYAHILLPDGPDREPRADAFAYEMLKLPLEPEPLETGDVWIALRWFYGYLALERVVGAVVNRHPVDVAQVEIAARLRQLAAHHDQAAVTRQDSAIVTIGVRVLEQAARQLATMDDEAIGHYVDMVVFPRDNEEG